MSETRLKLEVGTKVPWKGFKESHQTDGGAMRFSDWSMRDGWSVYEAVSRNPKDVPNFFVLVSTDDIICAVVDTSKDDSDSAWDKVEEARVTARSVAAKMK